MNMHMLFIMDLPFGIGKRIILLIMIIMGVALQEIHLIIRKIRSLVLKNKIMTVHTTIVLLIIILVVGGLVIVM